MSVWDQLQEAVRASEAMERYVKSKDQQIDVLQDMLQESIADRALQLEDVGWQSVNGLTQVPEGIPLESLKVLSLKLRELAASNPWHINGARLRHAYTFGSGISFINTGTQTDTILNDPHNKEVVFSVTGYAKANHAVFTEGNFLVFKNTKTRKFYTPNLDRIGGVIVDPDDASVIRYIKRAWADGHETWVPLARYRNAGTLPRMIGDLPVDQDYVAYLKRANQQTGWTWGVPDSMGALIFTLSYSGYLQDNATLVKALSKFAWNLTRTSQGGIDKAAAAVAAPGVGATSVSGPGGGLASVGVPSAQVNMNNGQPLIAAVAASFGVPVMALLESPGASGGSYGTAQTLDAPTQKGFESLQSEWADFYAEILHDLPGGKDASVNFSSLDVDPPYRKVASIATLVELGVIWLDEAREATLTLLDLPRMHAGMPPKPKPTQGTVVSRQGVSADVPGSGATSNPGGDTNNDNNASNPTAQH